MGCGWGEPSEPRRRVHQQRCRGQSREIPTQRIGADQHSPAWDACLLTSWDGWALGAVAWASVVRHQGEDWGWLHEDSWKGASTPQLAGKSQGKSLDLPKRQETIVSGCARRGDSFPVCPQKAEHQIHQMKNLKEKLRKHSHLPLQQKNKIPRK